MVRTSFRTGVAVSLMSVAMLTGSAWSAGLPASAAVPESADSSGVRDGGTATWFFARDFPSLNHLTAPAGVGPLFFNVIEPLLELDDAGVPTGLLAESWDVSDDGRVYTLSIREATFHDGRALTADDVVYSLEVNSGAPTYISNALESVESVAALDDRTVEITLSRPSRGFLIALAGPSGLIIPTGYGDDLANGANPIGTGPFQFAEWVPDEHVLFERFDGYWGEPAILDQAVIRTIVDLNAQINALLANDIDVATLVGVEEGQLNQILDAGYSMVARDAPLFFYVGLNSADPAFEDARVRQAISHAIDREAFAQAFVHPPNTATCTITNPSDPWHTDYCPYPYDPERARELLEEAGAVGMEITYTYRLLNDHPLRAEIIGSQLEAVGFTVRLEGLDNATFAERTNDAQFQSANFLAYLTIGAAACPALNTNDCSPELDELIAQADSATDDDEAIRLTREAVEMFADRAFLIPVMNTQWEYLVRDGLVGVESIMYPTFTKFDLRHAGWAE